MTRPRGQAQPWVERLRQAGVDAHALPLIEIAPLDDPAPVLAAWQGLGERTDYRRVVEAKLTALGAGRTGIVFSAVVPAAMPSFIATALFALEKATRSSVVLGLVGAGGIGIELKVAMDLFSYDLAATIILAVFALVVLVEQAGARLRARIM